MPSASLWPCAEVQLQTSCQRAVGLIETDRSEQAGVVQW